LNHSYIEALAAITYIDIVFVAASWLIARLLLSIVGRWRPAAYLVTIAFVAFAALSCVYVIANVVMLDSFGGFLTFQLLALVGDVRMLRSSLTAYLTPRVVAGLVCVPLTYLAFVWTSLRVAPVGVWPPDSRRARTWRRLPALVAVLACAWVGLGSHVYASRWATRQDRAIAENPQWVFVSSWWRAARGATAALADRFDPSDLADFERTVVASTRPAVRNVSSILRADRPLNVILIVLESVGARWTSLYGPYATTPSLVAESKNSLVFDNFYAHIGRSSNSLASMLLSTYPKLNFRDITGEYPNLGGTALPSIFRSRGYRTAFVTPSDLSWAGWSNFLHGRGFDVIEDFHQLSCTAPLSSWGVEDRCMVEHIIDSITRAPRQPFFVMGWTEQTHHPYEPTPDVPMLDLVLEHGPDDYDLNRYLNVLRETDRHLGRLFDALRRAHLDEDTMVVLVGDHGQAFGVPHAGNYAQGRTVYEEDVHVPLMFWNPRLKAAGTRSSALGGHVDLAPTIAALAGLDSAPDWQGRSLLDGGHPPRAYFYVAEDYFRLGVREDNWKYVYDLREGLEELYDLSRDPTEQHNVAANEPQRSARLRQRLAAWTDANRRQYHDH
jgi:phosphoglycerol transferase MdoB-like AlkP superfamily enzyme